MCFHNIGPLSATNMQNNKKSGRGPTLSHTTVLFTGQYLSLYLKKDIIQYYLIMNVMCSAIFIQYNSFLHLTFFFLSIVE